MLVYSCLHCLLVPFKNYLSFSLTRASRICVHEHIIIYIYYIVCVLLIVNAILFIIYVYFACDCNSNLLCLQRTNKYSGLFCMTTGLHLIWLLALQHTYFGGKEIGGPENIQLKNTPQSFEPSL